MDTISGGTIADGVYLKLLMDVDKVGYIRLPDGTFRTTISGSSEGIYNGMDGNVTFYIPKDNVGFIVGQSGLAGNLLYNGMGNIYALECLISSLTANNSELVDVGATPCINLIAPKALTVSALISSLTDKSIGDILYAAYTDNREEVNYTFGGGNNALQSEVNSYLLATYGVTYAAVYARLVTANLGTILIDTI